MENRIYGYLVTNGFMPVGSLILKGLASCFSTYLDDLAKKYPNDAELGCELRKLLNE